MTRLIFRRDKFKFIICNRLRNKENFITHTWSSSQCVRKVNFVIDDAMDNSLQVELRLRWRFRRISVKNILWPVGVVHVILLIVWRHQNQIQNQHWTLGLLNNAHLSKEKEGIYKLEEFLTKNIVSTKDICSRCIFFKLKWLPLIGNRTSCCPILSVIILVINKSDSHFAFIWFWSSLTWLQTKLDST